MEDNKKFQVFNFFPTPVFCNNIDIDVDTKEFLLNSSFERMTSNNGNMSENPFILDNEVCKDFVDKLFCQLELFADSYLRIDDSHFEWYMQNSWVVEHNPNDFGHAHHHANSLISGVYYLDVPEHSGDITFHKPAGLTNIFHVSTDIPYKEYTPINCGTWSITPREGDIILFPSHLLHSIGENATNKLRYSLAFNFHIKGSLGSKDSETDHITFTGR